MGPGLKVHPKFLGPYRIVKELRHERYIVETIGEHDGPKRTSTSTDHLKPWPQHRGWNYDIDLSMEDDDDHDIGDVEDDAHIRMAKCGNENSNTNLICYGIPSAALANRAWR
ncbi:hypothetical protein RF55_15050 [Lasius niger]|uniref:Uncharacterized protein n=1 Tax=Lasius niger TaxID=67767 RepID=A0A0J7N0B2_LASNI|nr:hypothetical protein RF55_15050 [Lasius niger]